MGNIKTQTRTFAYLLGGEEGLKNVLQGFGRDSDAIILAFHDDTFPIVMIGGEKR
jgi:hypothetical protein